MVDSVKELLWTSNVLADPSGGAKGCLAQYLATTLGRQGNADDLPKDEIPRAQLILKSDLVAPNRLSTRMNTHWSRFLRCGPAH